MNRMFRTFMMDRMDALCVFFYNNIFTAGNKAALDTDLYTCIYKDGIKSQVAQSCLGQTR